MSEKFFFLQVEYFIHLICLFLFIIESIKADTLSCQISVPSSVTSQKLDNIICIGESGFAYSNFATFSNGSLIIESSKDSGTVEREFYGITKEGTPYFKENQYHMSLNAANGDFRKEAENFVIRINDEQKSEYLMSVGNKINIELYDLNQKTIISKSPVRLFLENLDTMDSQIQTGFQFYDGTYYYLFYGYMTLDLDFRLKKFKFTSTDLSQVNIVNNNVKINPTRGTVASCYITDNSNIVCLVMYKILLAANFYGYVYDKDLNEQHNVFFDYQAVPSGASFPYFLKCIHLKGEIGVFAFYKSEGISMSKNPIILFKIYQNKKLEDYIPKVTLDKKSFNKEPLFNDLIKVNENKVCFISTSENKEEMILVLLSIYGNSEVAVRYYTINIFSIYAFKFYKNLRANLYINYISFAFSFCRTSSCDSDSHTHYSGFIVFNYPNGTDHSENLNDIMFSKNEKIKNFTINLKEHVKIQNNIFGLITYQFELKKFINCNPIIFSSSQSLTDTIEEGYFLNSDENLVANSIPLNKIDCSINYIYHITEPDLEEYDKYPNEKIYPDTYNELYFSFEKNTYQSRLLHFNLSINEELSEDCSDRKCLVCKENKKNYCIVCKYDFIEEKDENNIKYKVCLGGGVGEENYEEETESILNEGEDEERIKEENYEEINEETNEKKLEETNDKTNEEINEKAVEETNEKINEKIDEETNKEINEEENGFSNKTEDIDDQITDNFDLNYSNKIIQENISREYFLENIDISGCSIDKIISKECQNINLENSEKKDIYEKLKEIFSSGNYDGEPKVFSSENVIYQISTSEYQKNNNDPNVSSIDLGQCENTLKDKYNISQNQSLLIFKMDTKSEDKSQTYVYYEIYDPKGNQILNLSYCENKIIIQTPIDLDDNSIMLYEDLKKYGYNIFDSEDDFYTDVCSIYTTPNGTDMLIEERKKKIYSASGNVTMCQDGCDFILYNVTTKKSVCDCEIKTETIDEAINEEHFSTKKLANEFLKTITNSNFIVLKCYKLAFNFKKIFKNIGRIIMTIVFIFYLISLFCYLFKDRKKIDEFILSIIENKIALNKSIKTNLIEKDEKVKIKNNSYDKSKEKKSKFKSESKDKNKSKKKKSKKKSKNFPPKKNKKKKYEIINNTIKNISANTISPLYAKNSNKNININIYPINEVKHDKNKINKNDKEINIINDSILNNNMDTNLINYDNMNDQELNSLDYNIAVCIDKRTYFQYYWSLLKKKHLILFTFIPANDYNLFSLKIALFLLSFSLYLTINGFFFTDSTMNKITEDNGNFDILYQIPQILYSSIISAIINMLLKVLSLSEKNIINLKGEKDPKKVKKDSKNIRKCLIIKFIIFFIISNLLLLFFWYFITCFCAVYTNTQMVLFKDTIISFILSMIYPFGLNLIPGFFRIPALRDKTKKSKYLYQVSGFIALI